MNHIEVMKRMIGSFQEVLAYCDEQGHTWACLAQAKAEIEAGRQAIAEAEKQEPVAWRVSYPNDPELGFWFAEGIGGEGCLNEPLYTHPQPTESACDTPQYCKSVQRCTAADTYRGNQPKAEQDCFWKREGYKQCPNSQPKREWIGLTDEEAGKCRKGTWQATFQAIDTLLREKNGGKA